MKKRSSQMMALAVGALLSVFAWGAAAHAQGVTTSALSGRVTSPQGEPVRGATVEVTHTQTGAQARVVTREDGRYTVQGLQPGGPYRISVRGLGFSPQSRTGIQLALSQTIRQDFQLSTQAVALEALTVTADRGGVISRERTGTATVVNDSALRRLPTITRDFTDFTRLTPQISTAGEGSNAGGRNSKFNSIQIDGAANNDLFGLNAAGTPGSGADAKPISLEAIQEFQVAIAPYDVRQGGFTGAAINAVTKRGTNRLTGSATYFTRNENLVGNYRFPETDLSGTPFDEFDQTEAGFSLGGPVLRDRLHFFVAGELNRRSAPINNVAGTGSSEVTLEEAQEVADILRSRYGYAPGELGALNLRTEGNNLFGRVDWTISDDHRFTLRHNYVDGTRGDLSRSNSVYRLGGSLFERENTTNSTVAQLNSTFRSQFFNELRVGYSTISDERVPQDRTPSVRVFTGSGRSIFAGSEQFSGQNILDQEALEVTNDLSFAVGRHNLTVGTHNEFFNFNNLFVRNAFGYYEFASPEDLAAGTPRRYEYSFLVPDVDPNTPGDQPGAPRSAFDVRQFSVYAQDQIDLFSGFTLTAGLRYDVTTLPDEPTRNLAFESTFKADSATVGGQPNQFFGRQTNEVPSGNGQISPRIGFNWDVSGDRSTQLRGGVGLFAGRTPGVYVSNAYGNTGLEYVRFVCSSTDSNRDNEPPAFSPDPNNQPRSCLNRSGQPNQRLEANEVNLLDPDFKLPQILRANLAVDRNLPFGLVGTLEGLYSKSRDDVLYRELNLGPLDDELVEGRPRYTGRINRSFANVTDVTNTDEGYNYSLTGQVQRPFRDDWQFSAAYTYTRARDVTSLTSSQAFSNFRFNPINGDPNNPDLAPSNFEVPHRFLLTGSRQFEIVRRAPTDISFIYTGESGRPYSYTYSGDVNNDGSNANDLIYVPRSASEIRFEPFRAPGTRGRTDRGQLIAPEQSYQNLNAFIESVECLREARGRVINRNECNQPWNNQIDVRVAQTIPTFRRQGVQVIANVINFANLLNEDWGLNQFVSNQNDAILRTTSTTPVDGRVQFQAFDGDKRRYNTSNLASRYQIQLGVRYSF